jgi:hypothetical protein
MFFHWSTTANPGEFMIQSVNIPFHPDECIVRQITFVEPSVIAAVGMYFIWSSLKNDYIGTFAVSQNSYNTYTAVQLGQSSFMSNPQTVVIPGSHPSAISFRIDALVNGNYVPQTTLTGNVNVQIDFIKYKEN